MFCIFTGPGCIHNTMYFYTQLCHACLNVFKGWTKMDTER
jgi:hypothetical protein